MGNSYTIELDCDYCGTLNKGIYFAESCGVTTFVCEDCGECNGISIYFESYKIDKKTNDL